MAEYEGEYEPEYEEGFLEEQPLEGEYDQGEYGDQGYAQGDEVNINIPSEEDYPAFDELGLTDDAVRIVQEFVMSNGHLRLTADELAEAMRDTEGQEHPDSIQFARMVLDVWRMRNPDIEAYDEEYPGDEVPQTMEYDAGYEAEAVVEAAEDMVDGVIYEEQVEEGHYEDAPYETMVEEAIYGSVPEPMPEETNYLHEEANAGYEAMMDTAMLTESDAAQEVIEIVSEVIEPVRERRRSSVKFDEDGFNINVPSHSDYPFYNDDVDRIHRLVEGYVVRNSNLMITPDELAASLVDADGSMVADAVVIASMVLDVWSNRNPRFAVAPRRSPPPPPAYTAVPAEYATGSAARAPAMSDVSITVPPYEDFPPTDRFGLLENITRLVYNFVMETSTLAITDGQLNSMMSAHGGDQYPETWEIATKVLAAWRKRNPYLPTTLPPKKDSVSSSGPGVIRYDAPKTGTVSLPGGNMLIIPPESDYPSFDRSGLTDDAIRIVREFVTETGSLGITEDQVANQMVDFMGNRSPEALPIASMVLGVWRNRNPALPLTSVKDIYPGVIESRAVPTVSSDGGSGSISASSLITAETSKNAVIPEGEGVLTTTEPGEPKKTTYGTKEAPMVHQQRQEDSRDVVLEAELAILLDRLGCEVEPFLSPIFGPGIRIRTVSSKSILYHSGVEPGDAVIEVNGLQVTRTSQLYSVLSRIGPGGRFIWRFRRHSIAGSITEFSVLQTMPDRTKKAIDPQWAGLPPARPYRSHSGLLPADPGFREAYAPISSVRGCAPLPTQKYWDTRVVDGGIIQDSNPVTCAPVCPPARSPCAPPCQSTCVTSAPATSIPCGVSAPAISMPRTVSAQPAPSASRYGCQPISRRIEPVQEIIPLSERDMQQVTSSMVNKYLAQSSCTRPATVQRSIIPASPPPRELAAALDRSARRTCDPCVGGRSLVASRYAQGLGGQYLAASPVRLGGAQNYAGASTLRSSGSYVRPVSHIGGYATGSYGMMPPSRIGTHSYGGVGGGAGCSSCAV